MRKQLSTELRCWTHYSYNKAFKNKPPVPFIKSVEVIEEMHDHIIDYITSSRGRVQFRKSIGYIELTKTKVNNSLPNRVYNWKKTKIKGKAVKELNHHTDGHIFRYNFQFADYGRMRLFKFKALRKHNRELAKKIFAKDVQ